MKGSVIGAMLVKVVIVPLCQRLSVDFRVSYKGFSCLRYTYYTRYLPRIKDNVASQKAKGAEDKSSVL